MRAFFILGGTIAALALGACSGGSDKATDETATTAGSSMDVRGTTGTTPPDGAGKPGTTSPTAPPDSAGDTPPTTQSDAP